jgi:hypothetical protein
MLFVFLALYVALGIACVVMGVVRHRRVSVLLGVIALGLALVSFVVWLLSELGSTHWSVSMLEVLLSPMPESLLDPTSLEPATQGGVPNALIAAAELIVALILWAIPVLGLVFAGRGSRRVA